MRVATSSGALSIDEPLRPAVSCSDLISVGREFDVDTVLQSFLDGGAIDIDARVFHERLQTLERLDHTEWHPTTVVLHLLSQEKVVLQVFDREVKLDLLD